MGNLRQKMMKVALLNINNFSAAGYQTRSGFRIFDEFYIILVDRDSNTLITRLNRINSFRQLVFMGNGNGVIGYGKGKGKDVTEALSNALIDAKKNLVPLKLDPLRNCPLELSARSYGFKLKITPRHGFNAYGHPHIAVMLQLAGITDCKFKCLYKSRNPYSMVYAFMEAITQ
jgi:small subunit ribosomal protein S5